MVTEVTYPVTFIDSLTPWLALTGSQEISGDVAELRVIDAWLLGETAALANLHMGMGQNGLLLFLGESIYHNLSIPMTDPYVW